MKILFLTSSGCDNLEDAIQHGFRSFYAADVVGFPKKAVLEKKSLLPLHIVDKEVLEFPEFKRAFRGNTRYDFTNESDKAKSYEWIALQPTEFYNEDVLRRFYDLTKN